jgi:environmental stress-induced protein Ves
MRLIRAATYHRMRWKNGGGETQEIVVSPPGASLENFDWRISMAHVAAGGPFSLFPGVDRTLAVLEGDGIVLDSAGRDSVMLDRSSPPHAFPADVAVQSRLIGGAIDDLNVMTRRGAWRHRLMRLTIAGPASLARRGEVLALLFRHGACHCRSAEGTLAPAAGDSLVVDAASGPTIEIRPEGRAEIHVIDLWLEPRGV